MPLGFIAGGVIGAVGSVMAGNAQANAAEQSAAMQQQMFNQTVQNEQPFMQAGQGAQSQLNYLLGIPGQWGQTTAPVGSAGTAGGYGSLLSPFTVDQFHNMSPAYQFQLQQGQQGVLNGDAAGAGALSGAAQKDLMGYNQSAANSAFNNAFNQYQTQQGNIYSRLAGVAQTGQAAASNQATGASNFGASIGAQVANAGTATAGGIVGATNNLGSALPWMTQGGGSASSYTPDMGMINGMNDAFSSQFSDRRLKTDIERVGEMQSGLALYRFKYIWDETYRVGVMADEAEKMFPDAVTSDVNGFKKVNYRKIR